MNNKIKTVPLFSGGGFDSKFLPFSCAKWTQVEGNETQSWNIEIPKTFLFVYLFSFMFFRLLMNLQMKLESNFYSIQTVIIQMFGSNNRH